MPRLLWPAGSWGSIAARRVISLAASRCNLSRWYSSASVCRTSGCRGSIRNAVSSAWRACERRRAASRCLARASKAPARNRRRCAIKVVPGEAARVSGAVGPGPRTADDRVPSLSAMALSPETELRETGKAEGARLDKQISACCSSKYCVGEAGHTGAR